MSVRVERTVNCSSQWPGRSRGLSVWNCLTWGGGGKGIGRRMGDFEPESTTCLASTGPQPHWGFGCFAVVCMADTTAFRSLLLCLMRGDKGGLHSQFISSKKKNHWAFHSSNESQWCSLSQPWPVYFICEPESNHVHAYVHLKGIIF